MGKVTPMPKHDSVDLRYIYERMQLIRFSISAHKRYYISEYQNLELEIPDFIEQTSIIDVISDTDYEITELEKKLTKTRQIKQGMMQELLSGRIRLV